MTRMQEPALGWLDRDGWSTAAERCWTAVAWSVNAFMLFDGPGGA